MERKKLKTILLEFGYSEPSIKKIFQLKTRPTLLKAIELQERYGIPCTAWKNIREFISFKNDTKTSTKSSSVTSKKNIPKRSKNA